MNADDKLGKIKAAIGRVCLRFKKVPEASSPHGHVFAKCAFVGQGVSLFAPTPADGEAPAADSSPGSLPPLPPVVQSEAIDIETATAASLNEESSSADVVDGDGHAAAVVVDLGFSLDTTKFDLTEPTLSMLDSTEIKIDLCLRGGAGAADDTEVVVIGSACVGVGAILRGKNEWTEELTLGTYSGVLPGEVVPAEENEVDGQAVPAAEDDEVEDAAAANAVPTRDASPGPLEFGGSTSTMRVTLFANDDTADYTVGAGSLWTDGAEVTGVPEGWKVVPPPETERSAWNESIAQTLAGES